MCVSVVQKHKQKEEIANFLSIGVSVRQNEKKKIVDKINKIHVASTRTHSLKPVGMLLCWTAVNVFIFAERTNKGSEQVASIVSSMDNSLDMDMDGGLNRSLTNSQIYDGEFFEIVGSEGEILVVRYECVAFTFWNSSLWRLNSLALYFSTPFFSCNICTPDGNDGQLLRTSVKSNGNILKHIKVRACNRLPCNDFQHESSKLIFNFYFDSQTATALRTLGKDKSSKKREITCTQKPETGRSNDEHGRCEAVQKENGNCRSLAKLEMPRFSRLFIFRDCFQRSKSKWRSSTKMSCWTMAKLKYT